MTFSSGIDTFIDHLFNFLITLDVTWFVLRLYDAFHRDYLIDLTGKTDLADQLLPIIRTGVKFIIVTLGIIIGLDNAGYNVQAALAGLGISGLALALAAQDTVSNMFGGITVLLQRPFKTGDRIQVNGIEGYVRQVGLRCSIIESLSGKRSYVPNKVFISETVVNQDTVRYYFHQTCSICTGTCPKSN